MSELNDGFVHADLCLCPKCKPENYAPPRPALAGDELKMIALRHIASKLSAHRVDGEYATVAWAIAIITSLSAQLDAARAVVIGLLTHCDTEPDGESAFEQAVIRAHQWLAADKEPK
jgi:hypothetical protein